MLPLFHMLDTYEREIKGLMRGAKEMRCSNLTLITFSEDTWPEFALDRPEISKIKLIPAWKWLLET